MAVWFEVRRMRLEPPRNSDGLISRRDKTAALKNYLLEHPLLLKRATLAEVAAAFESEAGLTTSRQGVANAADSLGLERRRRRGPVPTRTEEEKRDSKRARQREWLRTKRKNAAPE